MLPRVKPSSERPGLGSLAFPSIITNLMFSLVVIAQTKFVGELGEQAIAAVGMGQRVFFATQALLMAITAGTTALVARSWGAQNYQEAGRMTMASLALSGIASVASAIPGIVFAFEISSVFGVDEETTRLAAENIRWMSVFNLAFAVNFTIGAALRAAGDAWTPFWISVAVNIVNIPLLYALVLGHWGFPALGVKGAAIAGGVAGLLGAAISVVLWAGQWVRIEFVRVGWMEKHRFKQLLNVGYPAGLEMIVFQVGYFFFLVLLGNFYGTSAFAAYSLSGTMFMLCMVVGFGFSIAGSTLAGQHLGANDPEGAVRSGWRALLYAALSMGTLACVIVFNAEAIVYVFLSEPDPQTVTYSVQIAWMLALSTPLMAIEFAIGGALRGAGDTRFPMVSTLIGLIGIRCVIAIACVLLSLDVIYMFAAMVAENVVKGGLLIARYRTDRWKNLIQLSSGTPTNPAVPAERGHGSAKATSLKSS
ncbi:MAG: MATE family efflux transporter [Pseudomonadales bacterium]|nr:MATE family efflux transporter [Pseudomonadales bacterium]